MRAVFHKEFNYTSRKVNAGWSVKPNSKPQTLPRECIEAAVAAKAATIVQPKKKTAQK